MTTKTTVAAAPTVPWRSRIVGQAEEAPDQLLANPNNWRTHPGRQRDALRGSLEVVGWVQQVMVNTVTGHLVDGHARIEEAISRGEPTVPVLYVELSPDEEVLVLATFDPIGAMATADDKQLQALLADIAVDDAGLLALLGDLAGNDPKAGLTDPDEVPETPEEPYVKPGDLYVLGDHRLLCGDATDPADVARLIADSVAKQGIEPDSLTIHADRGTSMTSRPVALLLADLGIVKSHSRPHTSDDNPYSEAGFKTLGVPARLSRPVRLDRGRPGLLRRLLQLVQRRAPPQRDRAVHPGRRPLRPDGPAARSTSRRPRRRLRRPPRALRQGSTKGRACAGRGLDQPTREGGAASLIFERWCLTL